MVKRSLLLKMLHCQRMKRMKMKRTTDDDAHSASSEDDYKPAPVPPKPVKMQINHVIKVQENTYNIDSCRVCLNRGFIPIFTDRSNDELAAALSALTNITISRTDNYPKNICFECHALLQAAIQLKKTAVKTDKYLRGEEETCDGAAPDDRNYDSDQPDEVHYCEPCDLTFSSSKKLLEHKRTPEHRNLKKQCTICHKHIYGIYFKKHLQYHKDNNHVCDICGKSFTKKYLFARHRESHGNSITSLRYRCHLCPYRARDNGSLRLHLRTHTGDRPYRCTECPIQCVSKSNLNRHMLSHKKNYSFHCFSCGKGFHTNRELDTHMRVDHEGVKEHVCNICGKAFGYRKQMMKHQLKVHKREKLKGGRMPLYLLMDQKQQDDNLEGQ